MQESSINNFSGIASLGFIATWVIFSSTQLIPSGIKIISNMLFVMSMFVLIKTMLENRLRVNLEE